MKKLFVFALILSGFIALTNAVSAQSPNAINYQSVVRDASGRVAGNVNVSVKVSLLQGSTSGSVVYSESFSPTTNAYGQIALEIGKGTPLTGNFPAVDWSTGEYFAKVEMDLNGGSSYTLAGTSQLLTVPYAKFADVAGKAKNEAEFAKKSELAIVATTGKYADLIGLPVNTGNVIDSTIILSPKHQTDSLRKYLTAGYRNFMLQAGRTYTFSNVVLPSNTTILGNGAFVIPGSTTNKCFLLTDVTNITLRDIYFKGQTAAAAGGALNTAHVAVHIQRSQNVIINGCSFINWLGAGIVSQGATTGISYYNYRMIISNNKFDQCFFGISLADRSEYCMFSNNILSSCRVGTWHSSGNWNINGNTYVTCRAPYLSYAKTSPFGSLSSDNWNHGSFVGNIMNHSNSGGNSAWGAASFAIGGTASDPTGVVINGVLPPTFTGNTLYYTNLDFSGVALAVASTPWQITGCVLSQMTVSSDSPGAIALVGCSKQANVTVSANIIEQQTIPTTAISTKTANYTLTDADRTIIAGSGVATLTLPNAVNRKGKEFIIKSTLATPITVSSAGGSIDGAASFSVDGTTVHGITLQSDGANWYVTSKY